MPLFTILDVSTVRSKNHFPLNNWHCTSDSGEYLIRLINVSSICKKQKPRQEKHKSKQHWKEFGQGQWQCSTVASWPKHHFYWLNRSSGSILKHGVVLLIFL